MREMKDSGVSFIGQIPVEWDITRNKNVFGCSKRLVGEASSNIQLLSLTTRGVKEKDINNPEGKLPASFDTYQYVYKNNIVMCLFDLDVSAVFSGISPFEGMISPAYRVLTCKENMVPKFADYWFRYVSDGRKFNHYAKNIRYTLSYEDFSVLPIVFPPYQIQENICDYLDCKCAKIDTIIEHEQIEIEKLKEYKLSVINETIVDVDGDKCHLGYIATMKNGLNFSSNTSNQKIKFLGVADFKDNFVLNSEDMFSDVIIDNDIADDYLLKSGDIIFVRSNGSKALVGRSIMVKNIDFPLTYSGFCIRFRNTRTDIFNDMYLLFFFRSPYFRKQLEKYSQGSNISNINQDLLSQISINIPSMEVQLHAVDRITKLCDKIDSAINHKQAVIDKISEYKKSLIYEVITGKMEV
ncbi:restriction endonuclease subunit S [Lacrimispora sp.]|uniref:restriction endonuclease subunit S n=1 Tax=Lacrimispora sp. TaxID=2719234 RepID=UPI002FD898A4